MRWFQRGKAFQYKFFLYFKDAKNLNKIYFDAFINEKHLNKFHEIF